MENELLSTWNQACRLLSETLSRDVYERWISVIQPHSLIKNELQLTVANDFYHDWLEENYLSLIGDALSSVVGSEINIILRVDKQQSLATEKSERKKTELLDKPAPTKKKSPIEKTLLNPKYTFSSFIVGSSNNFAHAASMAVAQSPARAYNPLFIYGGVGLGKTHLMQAIGSYAIAKTNAKVCYLSSETFTNEYIDALQRKSLVQFRKKYRHMDILLIDDIQFLAGKERMQEEFFHTFNALFDGRRQIVMTCDRPAGEIPGLEQRLVSRFEWGLVTELEQPDVETRIAILRNKEEKLKVSLSDEVLTFIAENIRSNIRRLEGALIRVASFASLTGKKISIEVVENLLSDSLGQEKQKRILSMEHIQRSVAEYYDIRYADIIGKRKPVSIAFPRQVAMFLCRDMTTHSLPMIGEAFDRNHATVLHACKVLDRRLKEESSLRHTVNTLRQRLLSSR